MAGVAGAAVTRIGVIVPALATEAVLLADCLANICHMAKELSDIAQLVTVVVPQPVDGVPLPSPVLQGVEVLPQPVRGVSRARNAALDHLQGRVDAVMFVDVAVRPTAAFLRAALPLLAQAPLVSAPITFADKSPEGDSTVSAVSAPFLVYRGFIWSSLIRMDAIGTLRFSADIGPGTPSSHQAGEDSRLLYAIVRANRPDAIPFLAGLPVARLPRADLGEKVARYSFGQGYLVGQYLVHPLGGLSGFAYFLARALLFLGKSLAMLMKGRTRRAGIRRLHAFLSGLMGADSAVPPLGRSA